MSRHCQHEMPLHIVDRSHVIRHSLSFPQRRPIAPVSFCVLRIQALDSPYTGSLWSQPLVSVLSVYITITVVQAGVAGVMQEGPDPEA